MNVDNRNAGISTTKSISIDDIKKHFIRLTENTMKMGLSDSTAFHWKLQRQGIPPLSSEKHIQIKDVFGSSIEEVTLEDLQKLSFPILSYKNEEIAIFSSKLMLNNEFAYLNVDTKQLLSTIHAISKNYNIVAYHNFSHAFSLTLLLSQIIENEGILKGVLTNEEIFYAYLAGLGHDLNHPGTNNQFQIKMNSDLSIRYNKQSVLQKMHVNYLWIILQKGQYNLLNYSSQPQNMKKFITELILSTDMAKHFSNCTKLSQLNKDHNSNYHTMIQKDKNNKYFVLQQLFHACDIGNPCLAFDDYMNWSALLTYEFNEQTVLEEKNGLQVTEMLRYTDLKGFYQSQIGFINGMVFPIWSQLHLLFPSISPLTNNIKENIKQLQKRIKDEEKDKIIIPQQ